MQAELFVQEQGVGRGYLTSDTNATLWLELTDPIVSCDWIAYAMEASDPASILRETEDKK